MKVLLFLLAIFVGFRIVLRSAKFKGYAGERKVARKLEKLLKRHDGARVFHDLVLQTPDGTTQIDHVVLSQNGIFVIETKNMSGWIFGGGMQRTWTQTIYKKKSQFQNPLHQNYKHVKALENLLGLKQGQTISVVVFVGDAKFKTAMPANVITLKGLLPLIASYSGKVLLDEDIERYSSVLLAVTSNASVTHKEHVTNVRKNLKNPVCPRCGRPMELRTNMKGRNRGAQFWGCPGFPSCRGTRKVR
ncbi:MAG: NERD domain-containing protein [Gammaproteobacteria bacterium]|nr:NERD domain-containing protein [Gammaproteobacteria bacterium]